jgi:hypothetical protein
MSGHFSIVVFDDYEREQAGLNAGVRADRLAHLGASGDDTDAGRSVHLNGLIGRGAARDVFFPLVVQELDRLN